MEANNNKEIVLVTENNPDEIIYDGEWLKIRKNQGFYYCERLGVDSVAFVLFGINLEDTNRIGFVKEKKYGINRDLVSAFGGSVDKEHYQNDLRVLVKEETLEESGFNVSLEDITYYGKVLVSSMMNQFCHLFGVNVNKLLQGTKTTNNPREKESTVVWMKLDEVMKLEDWKGILIVTKRMVEANAKITVRPIQKTQP